MKKSLVYTKTGDKGTTSLVGGSRVPKTHIRLEAYGTVDELNSLIGVVRHSGVSSRTVEMLDGVQARLVGAMGELATMEEDLPKYDAKGYARITAEDVAWLEEQAHLLEKECDIRFKGWARPGKEGSLGSAYLDLARSVCRRAERRVVALRLDHALSNVNTALFLNRLSDLCWVLARFEALAAGEKAQACLRRFIVSLFNVMSQIYGYFINKCFYILSFLLASLLKRLFFCAMCLFTQSIWAL